MPLNGLYARSDYTHPFDGCGVHPPVCKYFHKTGLRYHEMHHLAGLDIRHRGRRFSQWLWDMIRTWHLTHESRKQKSLVSDSIFLPWNLLLSNNLSLLWCIETGAQALWLWPNDIKETLLSVLFCHSRFMNVEEQTFL